MNRILIVRMSALGDIVHALPVLAALRERTREPRSTGSPTSATRACSISSTGLSHRIIGRPGLAARGAIMRGRRYDVAIDLQGLLKSAAMAWLSGATRVIGFEAARCASARAAWFYTETAPVAARRAHHSEEPVGAAAAWRRSDAACGFRSSSRHRRSPTQWRPMQRRADRAVRAAQSRRGVAEQALGARALRRARRAHSRSRHGLPSYRALGTRRSVAGRRRRRASTGAAVRAPETTLGDLLALSSRAALMVSGDTGPMHLAAAMGTPIVGLYGPTWPERNGPWDPDDEWCRAQRTCVCHHKRRCQRDGVGAVACAHVPRWTSRSTRCGGGRHTSRRARRSSEAALPHRGVVMTVARTHCAKASALGLSRALVLWLAQPTWRSLALGAVVAVIGEAIRIWAAGHVEKSREVTTLGAVSVHAAPAVSRLVGHRRRHCDRLRELGGRGAGRAVSGEPRFPRRSGPKRRTCARSSGANTTPMRARDRGRRWCGRSAPRARWAIASITRSPGLAGRRSALLALKVAAFAYR